MNKYKKIATAVVSIVLAGTMVGSLAACGPKNGNTTDNKLAVSLDENGKLTYAAGTTINFNVGNSNSSNAQGISYTEGDISGAATLIDGNTYSAGNLKPAWKALEAQLGITAVDRFQNLSSDNQITTPITSNALKNYDIITGSMAAINNNTNAFVNLADYLEYMPNYSAFLDQYPVTKYSLTGDVNGGMYAAPYFDGNDDIEYYHTIRKDWVEKILDKELPATQFKSYAEQALAKDAYVDGSGATQHHGSVVGSQTSIESYMGKTAADSYNVEVVNEDGTTGWIRLDYGVALNAAKDANSPLGAAIVAAGVDAYNGESGNIVDIQNYVINTTNGAVTGDKLAKIASEYIKVAYLKVASATATTGEAYYTTASDIFNSVSAAWDVDIMVATLRAIVCNNGYLDNDKDVVYGIVARQQTSQRRMLLVEMVGELYGVRGLGSRLEYLYLDADGTLQDARQDEESFEALDHMSKLAKEGILFTGMDGTDGKNSYRHTPASTDAQGNSTPAKVLGAMSYDYVQTQTRFAMTSTSDAFAKAGKDYNYAPILTPVSRWDENSDKTDGHEKVMRFTESWRTVKNTGFCVPVEAVKGNPDKFSAVLTFIDYLFSEDGQILMTYGTPSDTDSYENGAASDNGWWYAEKANVDIATVADVKVEGYGKVPTQYEVKEAYKTGENGVFIYNGEVYKGLEYGGRIIPKITKANYALFTGEEITLKNAEGATVGTVKQNTGNFKVNQVNSYTNYARYALGTTLPIGNKNQGFEYQCTAPCGIAGASIVDQAIQAGVIKHLVLNPDDAETPWYFISPAVYPIASMDQSTLNGTQQGVIGTLFRNSSSAGQELNVYLDIMLYGIGTKTFLGTQLNILGESTYGAFKESAAEYVSWLNGQGMDVRIEIYRAAWDTLKTIYNINL